MKTIAILLLGLAGCALSNTIPAPGYTAEDVGSFVKEENYKDKMKITGSIHLIDGEILEIREFKYEADDRHYQRFVPVKFVGEKTDGEKVDLTFKEMGPTGEGQQLSDTRKAKSQVQLNLGTDSARHFDKILIAVDDPTEDELDVLATAKLTLPTTTKPAPSTTANPVVSTKATKATTKNSNSTTPATSAPTTHGSSGSSTSQAGMLCLVVSVIAVLGH